MYAKHSHKKAEAIADAYNAFSLASARELNRNRADQATVVLKGHLSRPGSARETP
jgi:hypothetical protein